MGATDVVRGHAASSALGSAFLFFIAYVLTLGSALLPLAFLGRLPLWGVIETGQAEPMRWALAACIAVGVTSWLARGRLWPWLTVMGLLAGVATFCLVAGARMDWVGLLSLAALLAMVALAGQWFRRTIWFPLVCMLVLAMLATLSSLPGRRDRQQVHPQVGVMTALPLFWREGAGAAGLVDAPRTQKWLDAAQVRARPLDRLDAGALQGFDRLLLAQPRLLRPAELVALDSWVRGGGRLVILADPLLVWPSSLPLGHRLRPPVTSLLDPLLSHWGLELEPVAASGPQLQRHLLSDGAILLGEGVSRFHKLGGACRLEQGGLMALCYLGKGKVRLIADADLLDDQLWLADASLPLLPATFSADNVVLIDHWLADPDGSRLRKLPNRIVDDQALFAGVRWMLLLGLVWAGMGWWLQIRRDRLGKVGEEMGNGAIS